jgi:hypothetical protein
MPDQAHVEDQSKYTSVLQRELEGIVGSPSMSRVRRSALKEPKIYPVSNAVHDATKLQ